MKLFFLVVLAAVILSSCTNNNNGEVAAKQQIIDSLVKLVPNSVGHLTTTARYAQSQPDYIPKTVESYYLPSSKADDLIQNFHALFGNAKSRHDATIDQKNIERAAFLVPAITLQKLIVEKSNPWVVFYLGYDKTSKEITLIYDGANFVGNNGDSLTEEKLYDPSQPGIPMVFDNSIPCPKCVGIGVHTYLGGAYSSNIVVTTGPGGKTSPSGDLIHVKYGDNQVVKFIANQGYEIDEVTVNGLPERDSANAGQYTFVNVKATKTISVTFKPISPSVRKK